MIYVYANPECPIARECLFSLKKTGKLFRAVWTEDLNRSRMQIDLKVSESEVDRLTEMARVPPEEATGIIKIGSAIELKGMANGPMEPRPVVGLITLKTQLRRPEKLALRRYSAIWSLMDIDVSNKVFQLETVGEQLIAELEKMLGGEVAQQPKTQRKSIKLIIPFGGRDFAQLERVVVEAKKQLVEQDELIVSYQGKNKSELMQLKQLARREKISLVASKPDGRWLFRVFNLSRARNAGFRHGKTKELVMSLDCDIVLPKGFFDLFFQLDFAEGFLFIPMVQGNKTGILRPGTGISILPGEFVQEAGGWDERYSGWGSEDIDLLIRLERIGVQRMILRTQPCLHIDHKVKKKRAKENLKRIGQVYERPVKANGGNRWGEGKLIVSEGDLCLT